MVAAERFFVLSEAIPGVFGVDGGGDSPKIIFFEAGGLGIKDHLNEENGAGGEIAVSKISGSVGIKTSVGIVVDKGGGNGFGVGF